MAKLKGRMKRRKEGESRREGRSEEIYVKIHFDKTGRANDGLYCTIIVATTTIIMYLLIFILGPLFRMSRSPLYFNALSVDTLRFFGCSLVT